MSSGQVALPLTMPTQQKRRRNWNEFYRNGAPDEIIVIEDTPPADQFHLTRRQSRPQEPQWNLRSLRDNKGGVYGDTNRAIAEDGPYSRVHPRGPPNVPPGQSRSPFGLQYGVSAPSVESQASYNYQRINPALPSTTWQPMMSSTYQVPPSSYVPSTLSAVSDVSSTSSAPSRRRKRKLDDDDDFRSPLHNGYKAPRRPSKIGNLHVPVVRCSDAEAMIPCDDAEGHYIINPDTYITPRYRIIKLLGQGTFGKVVQCFDRVRQDYCAVKVIRAIQKYRDASMIELRALKTLSDNDPQNTKYGAPLLDVLTNSKCIHLRECFDYRQHICIVMDLLGWSVFDFLKSNQYSPFPPSHIRSFAKQLITSVAYLKPENILLVEHNAVAEKAKVRRKGKPETKQILQNTDIRLIDFGSATFDDEYHSNVVSTRHYRAPEIIMGVGWSFPCDMWSVACILAEFYTGQALFQTHDNLEHLAMMETICGKMDTKLIRNASRQASRFFKAQNRLDYPNKDTPKASLKYVKALRPLEGLFPQTNTFNRLFVDLLRKLLVYDPSQRLTARQALMHPFFGPELDNC